MVEIAATARRGGISPFLFKGYMMHSCVLTVFISAYESHSSSWYRHAPHRGIKDLWGEDVA